VSGATFDPDAVRRWLRILHGDSPGRIHVASTVAWSGPSFPTSDVDAAVTRVGELDVIGPLGIYVRMTTLRAALPRGARGGVADSLALPALWADIDIAGPAHKDQNLPPDWDAAEDVVCATELPAPTLWIDSGHGAYPLWLLDESCVLNDDNLADVADLSANWQRVIAAGSAKLGWHYGTGVGDLARVLRIPGTVNRKAGDERMCRIVPDSVTDTRYSLAALFEWCADAMAALEVGRPPDYDQPRAGDLGRAGPEGRTVSQRTAGELSPGDDFIARATWAEILEPHGWRLVRTRGDICDWCRPGKAAGISATTNALGTDRFHVFTTSTEFETTSYSKLGVLAVLEHNGDHSAAASALRARGYGGATGWENDRQRIEDYLSGLTDSLPATVTRQEAGRLGSDLSLPPVAGPEGVIQPDAEALDAKTLAELRHRQEVAAEARRQQVKREARKLVDAEEFALTWREPPSKLTLVDELAEPDEPTRYRVGKLLPVGGNAVLTAAFKAGKTTLCNNLLRSLADGDKFLGRFDVERPDGRIAVFNYEVSDGQFRHWLRRIGIANPDRVCVLNLRGFRMPIVHSLVEDWVTKWLIEHDVRVWIVDPFARAMVGSGDENSNMDVGVMLDTLDVIKGRAGVGELILPTHTGRIEQAAGMERARGATRLDDWADVRWLLTADEQSRRFFRAHGRDVEVDEELLTLDPDTGRLTMGGHDRRGMAAKDHSGEVVDWVRDHPGLGSNEIADLMGRNRNRTLAALNAAVAGHQLYRVEAPGGRGKRLHYVTGTVPTMGGQSDD